MNSRPDYRPKYERVEDQWGQVGWHLCCSGLVPIVEVHIHAMWQPGLTLLLAHGYIFCCFCVCLFFFQLKVFEIAWKGLEVTKPSWMQSHPKRSPRVALSPWPRLGGTDLGWSRTEPGKRCEWSTVDREGPRVAASLVSIYAEFPLWGTFHSFNVLFFYD